MDTLHLILLALSPAAGALAGRLGLHWPDWRAAVMESPAEWFRPGLHVLACTLGGIAIALSTWAFAPTGTFLLSCLFGWTLLALAAIDLKHLILPDPLNLAAALLGLVMIWLTRPEAWGTHLIGGLAGFLVLFCVETAYRQLRGREGLGRGDAKLLGALGVWVGWTQLPHLLLVASASGLAAALVMSRISDKRLSGNAALAFGPWLALGGWVVWLSGPHLVPGG